MNFPNKYCRGNLAILTLNIYNKYCQDKYCQDKYCQGKYRNYEQEHLEKFNCTHFSQTRCLRLEKHLTNFLSLETKLEFEKSQEWVLRIQLKTKFCIFNWKKKQSFVSSTELKRKLKFSGRNMFWGGSSTEYQSVEEEKSVEDVFFWLKPKVFRQNKSLRRKFVV